MKETLVCRLQANFKTERKVTYLLLRLLSAQKSTRSPLSYCFKTLDGWHYFNLMWINKKPGQYYPMEGYNVWLLAIEPTYEPEEKLTMTRIKKRKKVWKFIKVLAWKWSQWKLLLPWGFLGGKERGSLQRSDWCYLLIYLQVMSNFKVAPKKITFFFFHQPFNMLEEPVQNASAVM